MGQRDLRICTNLQVREALGIRGDISRRERDEEKRTQRERERERRHREREREIQRHRHTDRETEKKRRESQNTKRKHPDALFSIYSSQKGSALYYIQTHSSFVSLCSLPNFQTTI